MVLKQKIVEKNTWNHESCPNCGMMYQMENRDGPIEIPTRCKRCQCPMNIAQAGPWMDNRAIEEHDDGITAAGKKLRGEDVFPPTMDMAALMTEIRESLRVDRESLRAELKAELLEELKAKK